MLLGSLWDPRRKLRHSVRWFVAMLALDIDKDQPLSFKPQPSSWNGPRGCEASDPVLRGPRASLQPDSFQTVPPVRHELLHPHQAMINQIRQEQQGRALVNCFFRLL